MPKSARVGLSKAAFTITILTNDNRWKGLGPTVKRGVEAALTKQKVKKAALTLLLTNDAQIKALNAQYRGKNKPTNVLSFLDGDAVDGVMQLGDIAMAYETIAREAVEQGKAIKHHISHLAVHGTLHLLGFDHEVEAEAEAMEKLEIAILARMGIANPYESE